MSTSKIIAGEELTAFERWELPLVEGTTTAEQLSQIHKEAYDEGFTMGQQAGLQAGQDEIRRRAAQLDSMLQMLAEPLQKMDDAVVLQVSELAMAVAKQIIRRELRIDPGQVIAVIREAMGALPVTVRKVSLYIHPDDVAMVREVFALGDKTDSDDIKWRIIEDPMLTRGGCRIHSENSTIDATVETHLNRIINTILGGERETDD